MPVLVQKYGGTSVGDVDRIRRVAERVVHARQDGYDVVVVVSAMAGATDGLLALARQIDPNPPRRELDMLLTTGERVSMALLSMAIQRLGPEAISFTGSQSGILTNDRHFDAKILEVRPHRIEDELARGRIVIVAGYQGMSYRREITTLGRGGSDATAVALAAALGAERAEIYSDVDGVYSADPRVVPDARHHAHLGYAAMTRLARAGAKVLHQAAVETAERAGLTILARSAFGPGRETRVDGSATGSPGPVGVVGRKGVARVRLGAGAGPADAAARRLEGAIALGGTPVVARAEAGDRLCATGASPDWPRARDAIREAAGEVEEGLGLVSVVTGDDARPTLDPADLGIAPPCRGAATGVAWALVPEGAVDDAVRRLHAGLFGGAP